ncbi:hypothetical protein KY290_005062 [Solanum tuberosum]|uniref:Uncharacterized protein n=1 Tax=Solanum tuberosum TaxID=4113 RepID=A0ABQ7WF46_SOLTU|nr:hypothetical protein KY289_005424 [Solanum tuberosum]KAH0751816.1 hypothetical protein KY285_004964 [Solanum tuberosum]KAH0778635.1 hypothetical protein KY290_005062 [Solanum tuberosum]
MSYPYEPRLAMTKKWVLSWEEREWVIHRAGTLVTTVRPTPANILAECGTGSFHGNTYIHSGEPVLSCSNLCDPIHCKNFGLGPENLHLGACLVPGETVDFAKARGPRLLCLKLRNVEKINCTKRKLSAQISFPEMMKGKKEAPSPSPPFCPRLLNQSRLTFPPLYLGERESHLWSTQRLKRQIVGQINPFRSSGKIYGIGKPKRIYQNRSILSLITTDNGPHHSMENRRIGYDTSFLTFNGFKSDSHETEKRKISCAL